jgi:hypothetical protein
MCPLGSYLVDGIGVFTPFSVGKIKLVKGRSTTLKSISLKDISAFWATLGNLLVPNKGSRIDLLNFAGSDEESHALVELIRKAAGLKVGLISASSDVQLPSNYLLLTDPVNCPFGIRVATQYFVLEKLRYAHLFFTRA